MAEFLTMQEAEDKFGKKGRTNAALTLGIIGTALVHLVQLSKILREIMRIVSLLF